MQRNANDVIYDAILEHQNNPDLGQWQHSKEGIVEWLQGQLDSGAAYYRRPKTANVSGPASIVL